MANDKKQITAADWLLGYAKAFVKAHEAGIPMAPLFPNAVTGGGGGGPHMEKADCPPTCTQEYCDETYESYDAIWHACTDQVCRDQVYAVYKAALQACE